MRRFVRESKFRHCYGQPSAKDQFYDGVVASNSRLDGNICAVNRKFIAVVLVSSGGGVFTVLNRDKPGRVEKTFRCIGHTSEVTELSFDRFNPNRIASGSDDGTFMVWWIPECGLTEDLSDYQSLLRFSQRRSLQAEWHPSASDILICANIDVITVCNVITAEAIKTINTSSFCEQMFSIALNYDGTQCVASFKDKQIRVFDLNTCEKTHEFGSHEGSKPIKVAWLTKLYDGDLILTTGATKMSERQMSVWKLSDTSAPLCTETYENAASAYNVLYDPDTKLIIGYGKGECSVKLYEFDMEPQPTIHLVSSFNAQEAHRAIGFGNKLSCNWNGNEIIHSVRVLSKGVEEVYFYVPRRSDQFQDDLFPDTFGETAAMTAEDYIAGKVCDPLLVNLKDYVFPDGSEPIITKVQAAQPAAKKSVIGRTSVFTQPTRPVAAVPPEVEKELKELRALVERQGQRIEKLESQIGNQ